MPFAIVSTNDLSRDNHRIDSGGISFAKFLGGSPRITLAHRPDCPVGIVTAITVSNERLVARWDWLTTPIGQQAKAAFDAGALDGASIGISNLTATRNAENGWDVARCTLVDITLAPKRECSNPMTRALRESPSRSFPVGDPPADPAIMHSWGGRTFRFIR